MKFLIVLLILVGVSYAQIRVKLDDLRYALDNIPPAMKEQLQPLLSSLGMNMDDLEQSLENPSEEVQEIFGPSGISISDIKAIVSNLPQSVKRIFENKTEL